MSDGAETFTWRLTSINVIPESKPCHFSTFSSILTIFIWLNFRFNYQIKDGNEEEHFKINKQSGVIRTAARLDREKTESYHLSVVAEDMNETCHKGLIVVEVIVLDNSVSKPKFQKSQYNVNVSEDASVNTHLIKVFF